MIAAPSIDLSFVRASGSTSGSSRRSKQISEASSQRPAAAGDSARCRSPRGWIFGSIACRIAPGCPSSSRTSTSTPRLLHRPSAAARTCTGPVGLPDEEDAGRRTWPGAGARARRRTQPAKSRRVRTRGQRRGAAADHDALRMDPVPRLRGRQAGQRERLVLGVGRPQDEAVRLADSVLGAPQVDDQRPRRRGRCSRRAG